MGVELLSSVVLVLVVEDGILALGAQIRGVAPGSDATIPVDGDGIAHHGADSPGVVIGGDVPRLHAVADRPAPPGEGTGRPGHDSTT